MDFGTTGTIWSNLHVPTGTNEVTSGIFLHFFPTWNAWAATLTMIFLFFFFVTRRNFQQWTSKWGLATVVTSFELNRRNSCLPLSCRSRAILERTWFGMCGVLFVFMTHAAFHEKSLKSVWKVEQKNWCIWEQLAFLCNKLKNDCLLSIDKTRTTKTMEVSTPQLPMTSLFASNCCKT